jgi:hypothetical protein
MGPTEKSLGCQGTFCKSELLQVQAWFLVFPLASSSEMQSLVHTCALVITIGHEAAKCLCHGVWTFNLQSWDLNKPPFLYKVRLP